MKLSIITVCYNSEETIRDSIESVVSQNYKDIEYIIVDGGSTDNTLGIIKEYGDKISKVISERDEGLYDAMNKGVSLATGDVIGILNSDDVYENNEVISKVAREFEKENVDGVYGDLVYVDRLNLDMVKRYWKAGQYKPGKFLSGWMPPHPAFFVKRKVYQKNGQFNTSFRTAADYEIMLRFIHGAGITVSYLPEIITRMRVGGLSNSSLRHRINANKEDRRAWEINNLTPKFYTLWLKPLSKITQFIKKP